MTRSPGRTDRTSDPTASTTPAPSAPTMWGKRYSCGSPRTTNRSRWLSAAARGATRTWCGPREPGPGGSGTSLCCSWSRPPVARITQARMAWGAPRLRHERGRHHLLGAAGRDRYGRAAAQEVRRALLGLRAPGEGTLIGAVFRHQPDVVVAVAVRHEGDHVAVGRHAWLGVVGRLLRERHRDGAGDRLQVDLAVAGALRVKHDLLAVGA